VFNRLLPDRLAARPASGLVGTCALSVLVLCLLVGPRVLLHPAGSAVGVNPASDFQVMTWSLAWWPWAVRHGVDPLHTHLLWPPAGFSTLWMTTIPVPALLALPVTLTAGPLVAYNLLMLLAVPLAAGAAYLLCQELTGRVAPSLVGGLLFGLSPYMLGHTLSQHLDLTFVFPVPLLALLVVRYVRGRTSSRCLVAGFAALLLLQLGSSFELFLDVTLFVALGFALAMLGSSAGRRRTLLRASGLVALSYTACLPVLVPIALLALSAAHAPLRYAPADFAIDLLNVIVPTPTLLPGTVHSARALSQHFVSNVGEQDGYLGVPLLLVALAAVRAEWRRGAWLAGALLLVSLLLSLGPTLTVGGRAFMALPFALARLPLFGNALPARMSLFSTLAAACLCALWLSRVQRPWLRLGAGALVMLSLLPNFAPARRLPGAWSVSAAFGWSTPHTPRGFGESRTWTRVIRPGSTVLVVPTGDRTAASYWQAKTGMRFALAIPTTPFVPPRIAAAPVVLGLVNDDLRALAGPRLAAARLRAFMLADRIRVVVLTPRALSRWRRLVANATAARPITLEGKVVYRVAPSLKPIRARGNFVVASSSERAPAFASERSARAVARVWLQFDGKRAHLRVLFRPGGVFKRAVTLSSPTGDAELVAAAVRDRDSAAVIFTEWRNHKELLRIATRAHGNWRVDTLDERAQPIWSPRVAITPNGTILATWIDQADPSRIVRASALPADGGWQRPLTLENAAGLGTLALSADDSKIGICAWRDTIASETRVRVSTYNGTSWGPALTLASGLAKLNHVTLAGRDTTVVAWWLGDPHGGHLDRFAARRRGTSWTRPRRLSASETANGAKLD
jgi:hypothetical protein